MNILELPELPESASQSKQLTMEEYVRFVQLNLSVIDRDWIRRQAEKEAVNIRFELKDRQA